MINTFDRFYHHNNIAFSCPDFENKIMDIKLTGEKEIEELRLLLSIFNVKV